MCFRNDDRFYTPLPLYHTAGGAMSIGQAVLYGSCVVIRKKFSASAYFPDIVKYNCTVSPKDTKPSCFFYHLVFRINY